MNLPSFAREVLAKRVTVVAAVTAALHLIVGLHWLTIAQSDAVISQVTAGIDLLGVLVAVLYVRPAVTPVADPRDNAGHPLVPAPVRGNSTTGNVTATYLGAELPVVATVVVPNTPPAPAGSVITPPVGA